MGLFDKKNCNRCGKELGLIFGKTKIADGYLCKDCNALCSPLLTGRGNCTLAQIEEHIAYRKDNEAALTSFKASTVLGDEEKVYFDDAQEKFLVSRNNNYVSNNVDIFSLNEISSAEIKIDENKEEVYTTDKDGKRCSYDPKKYNLYYSYKIELTLNHKWVKSLTIEVNDEDVLSTDTVEVLRIDNLANEMYAKLLKKEFVAKAEETIVDENHWTCSKCGQVNENSSKFCTNCGEAKTSGAKFCGNCGTKLLEGTKFCPNCGKAVN